MKPQQRNTFAGGMRIRDRTKEKVVAAYPRRSEVSGRFMASYDLMRQYDFTHHRRIAEGGGHIPVYSSKVTNARNEIVRAFLDDHDADWLWFIDTDMTFDPDVVDKLVEAAHPRDRPIVGALCFSLDAGYLARPTLYIIRPDMRVGRIFDYTKNALMRCFTGTGCLLIHRSALERMRDVEKPDGTPVFPKPYEWFYDDKLGELPVGEDITFCIRAEKLGLPVHVHTGIKCGHEKPFIVDEAMFLAQQAAGLKEQPDMLFPTYVVIAAKNRHQMTTNLLNQLALQKPTMGFLFDNGSDPDFEGAIKADGWPLHRMWNQGLQNAEDHARANGHDKWNVAILNNDLDVPVGFLGLLESGLRADPDNWISYPNHHGIDIPEGRALEMKNDTLAGQTMSGWAFMLAGESGLRFDEQFEWWYGDSDLQKQVEAAGKKVVCVGGCYCTHLEPNRSTAENPERIAQALNDELRFAKKWGLDPAGLFLTKRGVTV